MIIDLKSVFINEGSSFPIEYSLDMCDFNFSGLCPLKEPVKLIGTVTNRASLVELVAEITYVFDAPCDRCGKQTATKHTVKILKSLASKIEGEESESILLVPDMKLDLEELIYSEVVPNLPMKHLCSEDCKGICFKCGKNLNEGKCNCPEKEIDPRLSALAELLNS